MGNMFSGPKVEKTPAVKEVPINQPVTRAATGRTILAGATPTVENDAYKRKSILGG